MLKEKIYKHYAPFSPYLRHKNRLLKETKMETLASSFLFGITIAISVGPIAMLIISRSINCGLRSGILSGTAAAFADLTYGIISFTIGSAIYTLLMEYKLWLQVVASAVLVLFGAWMLLSAIRNTMNIATAPDDSCKGVFFSTYLLTLANPLTIVAFTGFAAQSAISGFSIVTGSSVALFAGSLMIQLTLALFGSAIKTYISHPSVTLYLNVLSAFSIMALGLMKMF